jgi:sporulation protein YlmC with PRC-barrel domain
MRKLAIIAAATAIGWSLAIPPSITHAAQPLDAQGPRGHFRQRHKIPVVPAMDIVGKIISDRNGNEAGRIDSLIIDSTNGKIEYVLIDGSPNFDLGGHLVAVPWSLMAPGPDARTIGISVTADELRDAPLIDRSLVYPLVASDSQTRLYGYWGYPRGVDPYGYGDLGPGDPYRPGFSRADGAYASLRGSPRAQTRTERSWRDRLTELEQQTENEVEAQRNLTDRTARAEGSNGDRKSLNSGQHQSDQRSSVGGNQARNGQQAQNDHRNDSVDGLAIDQNAVISALMSPTITSASGLRLADVYSENGSLIGHIDQVVIDAKHGDIAYLLIVRDGSPRHNPTRFALPVQALTWARHESGDYRLTVSERLVRNVPSLPANNKNRSSSVPKQYLAELYAHFGLVPYWREQNPANDRHGQKTVDAVADNKGHGNESNGR